MFALLRRLPWRLFAVPALLALGAGLAGLLTLDPAGEYGGAFYGPGVTVDESFNIGQGVRLVRTLDAWLLGELTLKEVFGEPEDLGPGALAGYHLPDHPPLGRLAIGIAHDLTRAWVPPREQLPTLSTACARTASAVGFALLVFLIAVFARANDGPAAGLTAGIALLLMPRVFGHAHLAALETPICLAYCTAVLGVAWVWGRRSSPEVPLPGQSGDPGRHFSGASVGEGTNDPSRMTKGAARISTLESRPAPARSPPPRWTTAAWTGLLLGLALLTKIQAILLPIPVAAWALWHWRRKAIGPLVIWGAVGSIVFFAGWPWLWLDPAEHVRQYFGRATERQVLSVWYFGRKFADRQVPWHFPAVMFLTTVPVGLHLLAGMRLLDRNRPIWKDARLQLVLLAVVFPLVVFSLPGVAVYDGERLFLVAFPLWAVVVGSGGQRAFEWLAQRWGRRKSLGIAAAFLALQAGGVAALHPCYLSYYNLLVGGLRGADALGLEPTYWGDSLTRPLLQEVAEAVPAGGTVAVSPVLHQFQLADLLEQSPVLRRRGIRLIPFEPHEPPPRFVLIFRRLADLPPELHAPPPDFHPLAEVRRDGVLLAALYEVRK